MKTKLKTLAIRFFIGLFFLVLLWLIVATSGQSINSWILEHKHYFMIWRIILYISILLFWYKKLRPRVINDSNRNQLLRIEIMCMLLFSLVEFSIFW